MSETAGAENVIPPADAGTGSGGGGDNPAWSDFLSSVPESMHDMFRPHLTKWDQGVSARINEVHSQYADYKPFREAGLSAEVLQQGYDLYNAINMDPKKVWEAIGESYGYSQQIAQQGLQNPQLQQGQQNLEPTAEYQGLGGGQQQPPFNPEVTRLQEQLNLVSQIMIQQENARREAAEDVALDKELTAAQEKFGKFDDQAEKIVLSMMSTGMSADQAAQSYFDMRNNILTQNNRPPAPTVINGSGPLPSNAIDPAKLGQKDTVSLVAQIMKANNQQK